MVNNGINQKRLGADKKIYILITLAVLVIVIIFITILFAQKKTSPASSTPQSVTASSDSESNSGGQSAVFWNTAKEPYTTNIEANKAPMKAGDTYQSGSVKVEFNKGKDEEDSESTEEPVPYGSGGGKGL